MRGLFETAITGMLRSMTFTSGIDYGSNSAPALIVGYARKAGQICRCCLQTALAEHPIVRSYVHGLIVHSEGGTGILKHPQGRPETFLCKEDAYPQSQFPNPK